jgi:alpha-1,3-rhamnosyl/mannosyltransferase
MTLLTAFTNWAYNKEVKIVVVGPKWSENEVDFIKSNNLEKQLLLYRGIQDDDLCDLYNQAKACIYPSLYEGFGIPLLEAMACGCPVIASRIPSTIEVAGGVPYYFEPGNAQSLIAALDYLMLDLALENRVKQGLEKVKQYTWEETARKVYGVLKELNVGN